MADLFEKTIYLGLGLFSMTKERAQEVIDDLVERGKVTKDESAKAVRDLMDRADKEKKEFDKKVDQAIESSMKRMNLATQTDIDDINKKLDNLLKTVSKGQ